MSLISFALVLLMQSPPQELLTIFNAEMKRAVVVCEARVYYISQIWTESAWRPEARSRFAAGLAQFTPPTWGDIAPRTAPSCAGVPETDPACSIRAQVVYMRVLRRPFVGLDDAWAFAQAGYNGGAGWIRRERRICAALPFCDPRRWWGHVEEQCHPDRADWACEENREYPRRIRRWVNRLVHQ